MTWGYELSGLAPWWDFARRLEDMRVFATYTNERVDVTSSTASTTNQKALKAGTTSSVRLALQWDKRDNRLFPTNGFYFSTSVEVAPPFLAPTSLFGESKNLFTRYTIDIRGYRPLMFGLVARAKLTLGLIEGWDAQHQVPVSELYYVGGINSVRGYRYLSIAPTQLQRSYDTVDSATASVAQGGDKQAILNLELEFPLFQSVGVRGVVFYDVGNSFSPGKYDDPTVPYSVYKGAGFGFRWISPIGPLRFEWGFPLNRRTNPNGVKIDNAVDFQFTIGNFF
jgi:outer membrane protein insertion porin family